MWNEWKALFDALGNYKAQTGEYPQKIHVRVEFAKRLCADFGFSDGVIKEFIGIPVEVSDDDFWLEPRDCEC